MIQCSKYGEQCRNYQWLSFLTTISEYKTFSMYCQQGVVLLLKRVKSCNHASNSISGFWQISHVTRMSHSYHYIIMMTQLAHCIACTESSITEGIDVMAILIWHMRKCWCLKLRLSSSISLSVGWPGKKNGMRT